MQRMPYDKVPHNVRMYFISVHAFFKLEAAGLINKFHLKHALCAGEVFSSQILHI
jgi:hypothetical protein